MPNNAVLQHNFHMVTFHIGEKVYGIDIMHVKEISTSKNFTPVPNTARHVRGVFNLRGEIIPVIDLRVFLDLKQDSENDNSSLVILTLDHDTVAIVVDAVSHVIAVKGENVKQEHPLFSGIRGQYVAGILEHEHNLYIILNLNNILAYGNQEEDISSRLQRALQDALLPSPPEPETTEPLEEEADTPHPPPSSPAAPPKSRMDQAAEHVASCCDFRLNKVNEEWFGDYYPRGFSEEGEWVLQHEELTGGRDLPSSLLSPCRYRMWDKTPVKELRQILTKYSPHSHYRAWFIDCGLGHEAYSLMMVLRLSLPDASLRLFASDYRYPLVSRASTLSLPLPQLPELYRGFVGRQPDSDSFGFVQELKENIVFDYSDPLYKNPAPHFNLLVAREVLSRYTPDQINQVLPVLWGSLKPGGLMLLGIHERLSSPSPIEQGQAFNVYQKRDDESLPVPQEE